MNGRKLSVNKACLFLAVLLLVAMGTVSAALYGLTQNITAVWYVVLFGIFVLLCAVCFMVLVRRKLIVDGIFRTSLYTGSASYAFRMVWSFTHIDIHFACR